MNLRHPCHLCTLILSLLLSAGAAADTLRLTFVGDIMVHEPQLGGAWAEGGDSVYNFHPPFQYVQDYLSEADLTIGNIEVTFGGKPYRGYPLFSTPPEFLHALKASGFDLLFTANNHILDRGRKGLEATIDRLQEHGFHHTGAFKDPAARAARYPLFVTIGGFRLAFLNYTYDTNGLEVTPPNIVNLIDSLQIKEDLDSARALRPDIIIAYMHWGDEYSGKENRDQRRIAHLLAEGGAGLIIGAHPHVIQPIRRVPTSRGDSVWTAYSLGNFLSNQQERYRDGGLSLDVTLRKTGEGTTVASLRTRPFWVSRDRTTTRSIYRIIPVGTYRRNPAAFNLTREQQLLIHRFYTDTDKILKQIDIP